MDKKAFAKDLIDFIDQSPTAFHAVAVMKDRLDKAGFTALDESKKWSLKAGGKYYVTRNDSAIIAFVMGAKPVSEAGFRIIGSHSDSPAFKVKPRPEMKAEGHYLRLNTEVYGGPIMSTWMDRALSVAGRILVKTKDAMKPKTVLVNIDKDLLVIPNQAIHMNREVNSGFAFNAQVDTIPLMAICEKDQSVEGILKNLVADTAKVKADDILEMELFLYDRQGGALVGLNEEFIHVGRLDNLAMAHVSIHALLEAKKPKSTAVVVVNDNEEVGSSSKQGAHSPFLRNTLARIAALEGDEESFYRALSHSFIVSADQAHAIHPNHPETHDPTNRPLMNKGVVLKYAANQAYTTDGMSAAVFMGICKEVGAPYQAFVNRSDKRGGSTIGPITSGQLDISGLDIGNPILGMHSVRELGGVDDQFSLFQILSKFYVA